MLLLAVLLVIAVPLAESVGSQPVQPGEFPFIVSLRYPKDYRSRRTRGTHLCEGALIAENVVITVATCLRANRVKSPGVHINRFMREGNDEGRFDSFGTKQVFTHPNFSWNSTSGVATFNFALLVLKGESNKRPVEIHKDEKCFGEGSTCGAGTAVGWDRLIQDDRRSISEKLAKVQVPLVPRKECNATYEDLENVEITEDMVCAGERGKDMCPGGAPLLVKGKLAGLVSSGAGCGSDYPGVYANVAHVHDWIKKTLQEMKEEEAEAGGD